jgi:hypothetical protein
MHDPSPDLFLRAYLEAALWSSSDDNGEPFDATDTIDDFSWHAMEQASEDCRRFRQDNADDLTEWDDISQAGHDFWLTRNRHGAGFWDRGRGDLGDRLTEAAYLYPEVDLSRGDDGRLYFG